MENKTDIMIIAFAVFSIAILLSQSFYIKPALAVEGVHSVTGMTSTELFYNGGANSYIAHTASTTTIEKISTSSFARTTATLPAGTYNGRGDCHLTSDVCVFTTTANAIRAVTSSGTQIWSVTADSSATAGSGFVDIVEDLGVVIVTVTCSANTNRIGQVYDIGTGTFIKNVGSCAGTTFGNNINSINGLYISSTQYAITMAGSGSVGNFQIWDISTITPTRTCSWASVTTLTGTEGDIIKIGSTFYVSDGTTLQGLTTSCVDTTDITSASHGMGTIISLVKSTARSEYYVEDTTGFAVMNSSSVTQKLGEITCSATSATDPSITADEFLQIACLDDTANTVTVIEIASIEEEGGDPNGEFCAIAGNENLLICRLGGSGTLGSAGNFVVGNITQGTGILGIGCSLGIVDCVADDNPQTNGLGFLIFIASIFVIVGMFYTSLGANATFHLPVFIWVVIILALSAFFTITGLIDPVFLIVSVIALIALAAPKLTSIIQGSTFGRGSTE